MQWISCWEAVDFSATVYDTNDVQIVRGSSLGLSAFVEEAASHWGIGTRSVGGSIVVANGLTQPSSEPTVASRAGFRVVAGYAEVGNASDGHAIQLAQARARFAAVTGGVSRFPLKPGTAMCQLTRRLPIDDGCWLRLTRDQVEQLSLASGQLPTRDDNQVAVSRSAAERRRIGKTIRNTLLQRPTMADQASVSGIGFVSDLHALVSCANTRPRPLSVRERIAVIYLDGNSFGSLRARSIARDGLDGLAAFTTHVSTVIEQRILLPVIEHLRTAGQRGMADGADGPELRLDVLLYGGDDVCLVVPAWEALAVLQAIMDALDQQTEGPRLHFRAGVVIAPVKAAIVPLRQLSENLLDHDCKSENSVVVWPLEGPDPAFIDLDDMVAAILGPNAKKHDLVLQGTDLKSLLATLSKVKTDGIPRSQLVAAIGQLAWHPANQAGRDGASANGLTFAGLAADGKAGQLEQLLRDYVGPLSQSDTWHQIMDWLLADPDRAGAKLWYLVALWDYAEVEFEDADRAGGAKGAAAP